MNKSRNFEISLYFLILSYYGFHYLIFTFLLNFTQEDRIYKSIVDVITIAWFLKIWISKNPIDKKYIFTFLFLIFISVITFLNNYEVVSILTHLNGLRDPLVMISSFSITYYIINSYYDDILNKFKKYLILYAVLNIVISYYQFVLYGAGDLVGGVSGGSGLSSQYVFLISYFLIIASNYYKSSDQFRIKDLILYSLILTPAFINETKISYIFFIIMFLTLTYGKIATYKSVILIVFGIIILYVFKVAYVKTTEFTSDFDEMFTPDYLYEYLFDPADREDMTRLGRLQIGYEQTKDDPQKLFFGSGYGLFKGQNVLGTVKKADYMLYLYKGSTLFLFDGLMQGGLMFIALIILFWLYNIEKIKKHITLIRNFKYFLYIFIIISVFYNSFILDSFSCLLTSFLIIYPRIYSEKREKDLQL